MSTEPRGVLSVVTDAVRQAANLIQLEFHLARAELAEKAIELKAGLALIVAGAVLLTATLFLLLQAAVAVLVEAGLSPPLATLLGAAACAAAGIILISSARKHLEPEALAPKRIMNELARDSALAEEKLTWRRAPAKAGCRTASGILRQLCRLHQPKAST